MHRGVVFIAADYVLDEPWLQRIKRALEERGFAVIDGPKAQPPAKTVFPRAGFEYWFGRTDIILTTSRSIVSREVLEFAPRLRAVVFPSIGTDTVDLAAATELGIMVAHGPVPQNFNSMAESTILLILALMYDLHGTERILRENLPRPKAMAAKMLSGRTLGLVGTGRIAMGVAERLASWGVRIVGCNRSSRLQGPPGVELMPFEDVLRISDVVSMHVTLNDETRSMMGASQFALMRPGSLFVNTSRGEIVDEQALTNALTTRHLAGAALDTFVLEPLPEDSPLRALDNVILTPHMLGHTRENFEAIPPIVLETIERIMLGELPRYCRNPEAKEAWQRRVFRLESDSSCGHGFGRA